MNLITYHKATLRDQKTIIDYRIKFLLELTGPQSTKFIEQFKQQLEVYLNKGLKKDNCIFCFAKSGSAKVGIGGLIIREQPGSFKNPSGKFGYIMNMYTLPEFRRQGICTTILNELIKEGVRKGVTAFELHATKEGEPVYIQNGFTTHIDPTYRKYINKLD